MAAFLIVTNNPMVNERFRDTLPGCILWVNASVQDVLAKVKNEVHKGAVMVNHPLAGGVPPGQSPYKSVLVTQPQPQVDFQSARNIEEAIQVYRKNAKPKYLSFNEKVLNDLQVIDLELMAAVIISVGDTLS